MKPAYVARSGGALYQAGYRNLAKMPARVLAGTLVGIDLALAVSPRVSEDVGLYVRQLHVPFGDNSQFAGEIGNIMSAVSEGARVVREGGSVLTYCFYGTNRSGLVNALIVREVERCDGATALAHLRERRRGACGGNEHFVRYLNSLEAAA